MLIDSTQLSCQSDIIDICTETLSRNFDTFNEWNLQQPARGACCMYRICIVSSDFLRHLLLGKERSRHSTNLFHTRKKWISEVVPYKKKC